MVTRPAIRTVDVTINNTQHRMLLEVLKKQPELGSYQIDGEIDGTPLTTFLFQGLDESGNLRGLWISDRLDDESGRDFHDYRVETYHVTVETGDALTSDLSKRAVRVHIHHHETSEPDD